MNQDKTIALAKEVLTQNAKQVEQYLALIYGKGDVCDAALYESENYSLMAGGKRVRPTLVLEFCRLFGGDVEAALPLAAAVEMIHTFSLIHDDLPCMDDDDLRRGRPTNHKVYGEAIALLAGDGMVIDAFGVVAGNSHLSPEAKVQAVKLLSLAAGSFGMVRGQVIDMYGESHALTMEQLQTLHRNKTGALIRVSAQLGCIAAGHLEGSYEMEQAVTFAEKIGLAFQVVDDILDATATSQQLGKSVGGDAAHGKNTYLTFHTVKEAEAVADALTQDAMSAISCFERAERLLAVGAYLAVRKN